MKPILRYLSVGLVFGWGVTIWACSNNGHTLPEVNREVLVNQRVLKRSSDNNLELLIKFDNTMTPEAIASLQRKHGLATVEIMRRLNIYRMKIMDGKNVQETIDALNNSSGVVYAEPNFSRRIE